MKVKREELGTTICDYLLGDPEVENDILSYEVLYFVATDLVECFNLYPFGEVVCDCEHVDLLTGGYRKLPHYVHPPLHEGPW